MRTAGIQQYLRSLSAALSLAFREKNRLPGQLATNLGEKGKFCESAITVADVRDAMMGCSGNKSPDLDGVLYEFYNCKADLFGGVLALLYCNWQQHWSITYLGNCREVTLLKKTQTKEA